MIEEIITYLRKKTPYKFYFSETDIKNVPCIVYEFLTTQNDGLKSHSILKLHIMTKGVNENSIKNGQKIKLEIDSALLTRGDTPLTNNILSVEQNGGGIIPDKQANVLHTLAYYDVIHRIRKEV